MKKKIFGWTSATLNIMSALFVLIFAIVTKASVAANVFACIAIATVCINLLEGLFLKGTLGILRIAATLLLYTVNVVSSYVVSLSGFASSVNVVGIIALIILFLLNAKSDINSLVSQKAQNAKRNTPKIVAVISYVAGFAALVALFVISLMTVTVPTEINTNTVNFASLLTIFALAAACFALRGLVQLKFPAKKWIAVGCAILFLTVGVSFTVMELAVVSDIDATNKAFEAAFGKESLEGTEDMLKIPYSVANGMVGIPTDKYRVVRDVVYYSASEGLDAGLTLRYDAYVPMVEMAHKAVVLNLHGSGGEKDTGNYAHRNKYFASKGYVVFDLQFGDFNEKGTGFRPEMRTAENMLFHIDRFFAYASKHNEINADFSNTFLSGVSMGGSLVSKLQYSYPNTLSDNGVTVKGILPVYPGYVPWDTGINNYLNYITKDSVPCLVFMGLSDVIVRPKTADETVAAYQAVGNNGCVSVKIRFAGHGSDGWMSGKTNQIFTYYAERFMHTLRH